MCIEFRQIKRWYAWRIRPLIWEILIDIKYHYFELNLTLTSCLRGCAHLICVMEIEDHYLNDRPSEHGNRPKKPEQQIEVKAESPQTHKPVLPSSDHHKPWSSRSRLGCPTNVVRRVALELELPREGGAAWSAVAEALVLSSIWAWNTCKIVSAQSSLDIVLLRPKTLSWRKRWCL